MRNVSSAVSIEADRILEESLAVRSVERTVDEVLPPAVDGLCALNLRDDTLRGRSPLVEAL